MYSGPESTGAPTQWPINQAAYQNMANDQVDWAALAQQWIQMKEAGPPPIPGTERPLKGLQNKDEGGLADMEVENEKDDTSWGQDSNNTNWTGGAPPAPNWGTWGANWVPPTPPPPNITKTALLPTPQFNHLPAEIVENSYSSPGYNTAPQVGSRVPRNQQQWLPKHIKPHNRRYSKVNVLSKNIPAVPVVIGEPLIPEVEDPIGQLDAAKRKTLPAWIREGLEKMEREKQKQVEKEREKILQDKYEARMKQTEKQKMEILKNTMQEQQKSKFESDDENSDEDPKITKKRSESPEPIPLTHEELMLKVRRTMTEILLKVTSQEIETICTEERQRFIKKRKASDQRLSAPSGANIKATLGLGAYGSDTESDSDSEDSMDRRDSDTELKDLIRKRKADFTRTERLIEDKLSEIEKNQNQSRSSTPASEKQVDAIPEDRTEISKNNKKRSPSTESNRSEHKTRKKRSESVESVKNTKTRRKSRSKSHEQVRRHSNSSKNSKSRKTRSRSPTRSSRSHRSPSRSRKSHSRSRKSHSKSRQSPSRSRKSHSRSRRSLSRSRRSHSRSRRRSYSRSKRSRSSSYSKNSSFSKSSRDRRSRSKSSDRRSKRSSRRSRSRSRSRGKRSYHRH